VCVEGPSSLVEPQFGEGDTKRRTIGRTEFRPHDRTVPYLLPIFKEKPNQGIMEEWNIGLCSKGT
jgi:hypothetical protein